MYAINLNKNQEKKLKSRFKIEKNVKIYRRLQCIMMKKEGMDNNQIARILSVCTDTVTDWVKCYVYEGLDALCKLDYKPKASRLDEKKKK